MNKTIVLQLIIILLFFAHCGSENETGVPLSLYSGLNLAGGCEASACHPSSVLGEYPATGKSHTSTGLISVDGSKTSPQGNLYNPAHGHVYLFSCETCHFDYFSSPTHKDGFVTTENIVRFNPLAYKTNFSDSTGTCSSNNCHSNQVWGKDPASTFNTDSGSCTECHASAYTLAPAPSSGRHNAHINEYLTQGRIAAITVGLPAQNKNLCHACHNDHFSSTEHKNGSIASATSVGFHPDPNNDSGVLVNNTEKTYDAAAKSCATNGCHLGTDTREWNVTDNENSCFNCHKATNPVAGAPYPFSAPLSSHNTHINTHFAPGGNCASVSTETEALGINICRVCHNSWPDTTTHRDGTSDTGNPLISFLPDPTNGSGTCNPPLDTSYVPGSLSCGNGCHYTPKTWVP